MTPRGVIAGRGAPKPEPGPGPRTWAQATFVFISTNLDQPSGCVEERWLDVMGALLERGSRVILLAPMHTPVGEIARERGVQVDPYILDKWNVIRSRSRLRKYLRRYDPICAHSTGLEADHILGWAARRLPGLAVATTLTAAEAQPTRRKRPVDYVMRGLEGAWLGSARAVFCDSEAVAAAARAAGAHADAVLVDPPPADEHDHVERAASIGRHLAVYEDMLAQRGPGSISDSL